MRTGADWHTHRLTKAKRIHARSLAVRVRRELLAFMPPRKRARQEPAQPPVQLEGGTAAPVAQITMWRDGTFCDVQVDVLDKKYKAHRIWLATASPMLRGLLSSPMSEAQAGVIKLRDMEPDIFQACLEWIYTGKCSVPEQSLVALLHAAALLDVATLLSAVSGAFEARINAENCLTAWDYSERYNLASLRSAAKGLAVNNFASLPREELLGLNEERVVALLSEDRLAVESEEQAYETLMAWATKASQPLPEAALAAIRFGSMTETFLREHVHTEPLMQTVEAMQILARSLQHALFHGCQRRGSLVFTAKAGCTVSEDGTISSVPDEPVSWVLAYGTPLSMRYVTTWTLRVEDREEDNTWSFVAGIVRQESSLDDDDDAPALKGDASLNGNGSVLERIRGTLEPSLTRVEEVDGGSSAAGSDGFTPPIEPGQRVRVRYDPIAHTLSFAIDDAPFRLAFTSLPDELMVPFVSLSGAPASLRLV